MCVPFVLVFLCNQCLYYVTCEIMLNKPAHTHFKFANRDSRIPLSRLFWSQTRYKTMSKRTRDKARSDGDINTLHRTIVYIYFVLSRLQVIASLYIKSFGESTLDIQQGYPQKFLSVQVSSIIWHCLEWEITSNKSELPCLWHLNKY